MHITTTPTIKKQPGQAGHDGQRQLRSRRIETRVSPDEHITIMGRALVAGFGGIAQYVRQQALYGADGVSPSSQHKALIACQAELNAIAGHVNEIARHLTKGEPLDDEMLMVMLQVLDLAEENLQRIQNSDAIKDAAEAV